MSLEEFFYLLDSIEERLPARDSDLYGSSAVSERKLRDIIRYNLLLLLKSLSFCLYLQWKLHYPVFKSPYLI